MRVRSKLLPGVSVLVLALAVNPLSGQSDLPRPEDVETLDGIIAAFYDIVSGAAGEIPDRARDLSIHHPDATAAISGVDENGAPTLVTMTIDGYHDNFGGRPRTEPFYEYELNRVVQRFGNVVHVWSTYASSLTPGGEPFTRGINSIQLYHDGDRWWITSWIFDSERAGNPIPPEYLP